MFDNEPSFKEEGCPGLEQGERKKENKRWRWKNVEKSSAEMKKKEEWIQTAERGDTAEPDTELHHNQDHIQQYSSLFLEAASVMSYEQ